MFLGLELIVALIVLAFLGGMLFKWVNGPREEVNEGNQRVRSNTDNTEDRSA